MSISNEKYMIRAIALAKRGEGRTSPNPPVGAIVVKNGRIIAEGYHSKAGGPHAEVVALRKAGKSAFGTDLYITLEPCSTTGKTPPCTDAIITAGVKKVLIAARDPNPLNRGKGSRILKEAGVLVEEGRCRKEGKILIEAFSKWITTGLPYITLKMGMTIDGRIADKRGASRWITGPESRRSVISLRSKSDAILVGRETVKLDNPSLMSGGNTKTRRRVIIDSGGKLPLSSTVLTDSYAANTIVAVTDLCSSVREKRIKAGGSEVWRLSQRKGRVSLKHLVRKLGKEGIMRVLCEGGGELAGSLIEEQLVDEYFFFIAPAIIGSKNARQVVSCNGWELGNMPRLKFIEQTMYGKDVMLRALPERS